MTVYVAGGGAIVTTTAASTAAALTAAATVADFAPLGEFLEGLPHHGVHRMCRLINDIETVAVIYHQ